MRDIHSPMFLAAWKDAVKLYPDFFVISDSGVDAALSVSDLSPRWSAENILMSLSPNPRWALLAIWSLIDAKRVRGILKNLGREAWQQETDLMSFQWLAFSTATNRRDILVRLFAYHF